MKIIYKIGLIFVIILLSLTSCKRKDTKYTISFDVDGTITSVELKKGEQVAFPPAFKDNYTFVGWMLDGDIVTEYVVETSDVTFVATFYSNDLIELEQAFKRYTFDDTINGNKLSLKTNFYYQGKKISGSWESSDSSLIDNHGYIVSYPETETIVTLTLTLKYNDSTLCDEYYVTLMPKTLEELLDLGLETIEVPTMITDSLKVELPVEFEYNIVGSWISSDETILTSDGVVKVFNERKDVVMTLNYKKEGDEEMKSRDFTFTVDVNTAMHIIRADNFELNNMENVKLSNGKLVLKDDAIYGSYESPILETIDFSSLVASWSAVSSKEATVELLVSVRVDGKFSDYITYCEGGWGLGLQNASKNQIKDTIELNTDEINVLNNKAGDAVKFKLILRRTNSSVLTPKVSLVAFALEGTDFTGLKYQLDDLSGNIKYDVPRLYQGAVPTIGNSICSATSSTMLLKYKGMDFSDYDSQYEHRYIAGIVKDYGNNIYGNWVYNTVAIGGYGFDAYVARLYSINELVNHLESIGPVAISVKGQMTSDKKDYYTAGHLLCIIGYIYQDGELTFIANDPNVPDVECTYSQSVISRTWRNIIYVVE